MLVFHNRCDDRCENWRLLKCSSDRYLLRVHNCTCIQLSMLCSISNTHFKYIFQIQSFILLVYFKYSCKNVFCIWIWNTFWMYFVFYKQMKDIEYCKWNVEHYSCSVYMVKHVTRYKIPSLLWLGTVAQNCKLYIFTVDSSLIALICFWLRGLFPLFKGCNTIIPSSTALETLS